MSVPEDKYSDDVLVFDENGCTRFIPYEKMKELCKLLESHAIKVTEYEGEQFYRIVIDQAEPDK